MIKCPSGQIWCRGNLKVCDWFFTSFVLKSVEIKYGEGCTDRMQMHYHNYKLLIFRCLYRTIVIIDLLCGSKNYEDISRNVNWSLNVWNGNVRNQLPTQGPLEYSSLGLSESTIIQCLTLRRAVVTILRTFFFGKLMDRDVGEHHKFSRTFLSMDRTR